MAAGFSQIISKNKAVTNLITKIGKDNLFKMAEKAELILAVNSLSDQVRSTKPDDYSEQAPEPPPTQPTDAIARFYAENGKLTLEVVFTAPGNTGTIPTSFEIERNDDPSSEVSKFHVVGTIQEGLSWEEQFEILKDLPYTYRVRGVKIINGVTYYSAYSNVADPEPFIPEENLEDYVTIQPGSLNGKIGKFKGVAGKYTLTEPESKLDFRGVEGTVIEIAANAMLTHRGATNVKLTDVVIDGKGTAGGEKGPDNAKAMFQPGNGWILKRVTVKGGRGVLIGCDGSDIRATDVKCLSGGSSGFGGKCDRGILINVICEGNNLANKSTDGAAFGKFTRTGALLVINCIARKGTNATLWGDINNHNWVVINFLSEDITYSKPDKKWTGAGIKVEISANKSEGAADIVKICQEAGVITESPTLTSVTLDELKNYNFIFVNCSAKNTQSYCFDLNETRDVLLRDPSGTTPPSDTDGGHVSTRDYRRADAKTKEPPRDKDWVCNNVVIKNFKVLDGDTFVFWGGGAGPQVDGVKNNIKVISPIAKDGKPAKLQVKRATNIKITNS